VGDCQYSGSSLLAVGRRIVIVAIVSRMIVAVLSDVEMEVEEAGAELPVPMPVAGRMQAETADEDDKCDSQGRASQAGQAVHGSAEASHLGSR